MTEYQRWLADERIPLSRFPTGYDWYGVDVEKDMKTPPTPETLIARYSRNRRNEAIARFGFAIPNIEALTKIASLGPVLEVGAGTGYWAEELRRLGADVIATDPDPHSDNNTIPTRAYGNVIYLTAERAIERHGNGRALLLVWPSLASWPAAALKQYGGPAVAYVGEWNGCTADEEFHDVLERDYGEPETVDIPNWSGIHDCLYVMRRK